MKAIKSTSPPASRDVQLDQVAICIAKDWAAEVVISGVLLELTVLRSAKPQHC